MAFPRRRVLASAPASGLGEVQYSLDAPPEPARRFGLAQPNWFDGRQHVAGLDVPNRKVSEDRIGISHDCRAPLSGVFWVSPRRRVTIDEALDGFPERYPFDGRILRRSLRLRFHNFPGR